jgi:hypothetical protein
MAKVIRISNKGDMIIEAIKYVTLKKFGKHISKSEILDDMIQFAGKHDDFKLSGLDK